MANASIIGLMEEKDDDHRSPPLFNVDVGHHRRRYRMKVRYLFFSSYLGSIFFSRCGYVENERGEHQPDLFSKEAVEENQRRGARVEGEPDESRAGFRHD